MQFSILTQAASKSMRAHRAIFFPFLLAVTLLFALEYILLSLLQNNYVREFHPDFGSILGIGIFFVTLLIVIITLYTSQFIQKNQTQEMALYTILGLEKKHVRRIIYIQNAINWVIVSVFSVVLGHLLGNLIFIALNRMMQDSGATLMDYPFQIASALGVVGLAFVCFVVIILINIFKIQRLSPADLLMSAHAGEGEPKARLWTLVLGLLTLGGGYYIALTTNDVLSSMLNIFSAIFLVMIGTYLLFMSLSIFILKGMRKNKKYYYKPNHFLSVSGMLHRMKNNAVSLSSIAILCSGVILVLGVTLTVYRTMDSRVESVMPADYAIRVFPLADEQPLDNQTEVNEERLAVIAERLTEGGDVEEARIQTTLETSAYLFEDKLVPLQPQGSKEAEILDSSGQHIMLMAETLTTYNDAKGEEIALAEDEVLITSNLIDLEGMTSLDVAGKTYQTQIVSPDVIPSNIGLEAIYLAMPGQEALDAVQAEYVTYPYAYASEFNVSSEVSYKSLLYFNTDMPSEEVHDLFLDIKDNENSFVIALESRDDVVNSLYSMYGGLLFIGLAVSVVLMMGTILLLYFKQIAEGYDDRKNYQIMKQVGLPEKLIKKTIRSQILWVFFLPITVAVIHNIFGSKIMYTLSGLLGLKEMSVYATSYLIVLVIFVAIYLLFYWITSRAYYNIVNEAAE